MQMTDRNDLESIFQQALEFDDTSKREAYLDEVCGDDVELRSEMDRVLRSHDVAGSFLAGKSPNLRATEFVSGGLRNESVLGMFKDVIGNVPSITLRESQEQEEHIQRPSSPEIPVTPADGRYQLQGEIARGGMGVVIKGRDTDLGRDLAVKVLLDSHKDKPEVTQRFIEEAQIGGQLQHPGIAPVYELGQFEDQRPYFTMKLVKGKTLAALLASRKSPEEDRAKFIGIFEKVCQTMAYVHRRGVIHRDLKPANIMVGAFGEVQVMDWGLAKVLSSGGVTDEKIAHETHQERSVIETLRSSGSATPIEFGSQTQMGSVMGTPAYMAPEQALGEIDQLDQRADVFGLGAILCEVLTGKPPYVADDALQIYRLATRGKLDECFQRLDESDADSELLELAKSCLSREPSDRPNDSNVIANQLSKHLQTVETRLRESEIDRAAQTARAEEERKRRRVSVGLGAALLTLVVSVLGGGLWLQAKETAAANAVAANQEKSNKELRAAIYRSDIRQAQIHIEHGNFGAAKAVLMSCVPERNEIDLRNFEWHYLMRRCPTPIRDSNYQWQDDRQPVVKDRYRTVAYSDDRTRIAAFDQSSKELAVWDAKTGTRIWSNIVNIPFADPAVTLNEDGTLIGFATASLDPRPAEPAPTEVHIWNIEHDEKVCAITANQIPGIEDRTVAFAFQPSTTSIAMLVKERSPWESSHSFTRSLFLWDYKKHELRYELQLDRPHAGWDELEFSPDGSLIAIPSKPNSKGFDENAKRWDGRVGIVHLIDGDSGKILRDLTSLPYLTGGQSRFSPDGKRYAMSAMNQSRSYNRDFAKHDALLIWDVESGSLITVADCGTGRTTLEFDATGEFVLADPQRRGGSPELIQVADGSLMMKLENNHGTYISFSDDGKSLQTIDGDGKRWSWPIPKNTFDQHANDVFRFHHQSTISGDGKRFIRFGQNGESSHVFSTDGTLLKTTRVPWIDGWHPRRLNHDGTILAVENMQRDEQPQALRISLWNVSAEKELGHVFEESSTEQRKDPKMWDMSPTTSRMFAVITRGDEDNRGHRDQLRIWDQITLEELQIDLKGVVSCAGFTNDGKHVGVFTYIKTVDEQMPRNGTFTLYEAESGRVTKSLALPSVLDHFTFSKDDRLLVGRNVAALSGTGFAPWESWHEMWRILNGREQDLPTPRMEVWDLQTTELRQTIDSAEDRMVFSPDGSRLVSKRRHEISRRPVFIFSVWETKTGRKVLSLPYFDVNIKSWTPFDFLPGSQVVVDRPMSGIPKFWDGTPLHVQRDDMATVQ